MMTIQRQGGKPLMITIPDFIAAVSPAGRRHRGVSLGLEYLVVLICVVALVGVTWRHLHASTSPAWVLQESTPIDVIGEHTPLLQLASEFERLVLDSPCTNSVAFAGLSYKPTCVNKQAIEALNAHLHPRTIHIVTTSQAKCNIFLTFASNIKCHQVMHHTTYSMPHTTPHHTPQPYCPPRHTPPPPSTLTPPLTPHHARRTPHAAPRTTHCSPPTPAPCLHLFFTSALAHAHAPPTLPRWTPTPLDPHPLEPRPPGPLLNWTPTPPHRTPH